jgi:glycosyltransferase involved in cell wall biosynthesis
LERAVFEGDLGAANVVELPLPLPPCEPDDRPFEARRHLLFVGSTHPPNVDAVEHLVHKLLPAIRRRLTGVELCIVGDVCEAVRKLGSSDGVRWIGHVKSLEGWLGQARVFVAPLRYGAGIKGKLLLAMGSGLPLVTTPVGAEGLGLEHRASALVAENDDEFVAEVGNLYTDAELWGRVRAGALQRAGVVASGQLFDRALSDFLSRLEAAAGKRRATGGLAAGRSVAISTREGAPAAGREIASAGIVGP